MIFYLALLSTLQSLAVPSERSIQVLSLSAYKETVSLTIEGGGNLRCPVAGAKIGKTESVVFSSCGDYRALREKGCYGGTSQEIIQAQSYNQTCLISDHLVSAKEPKSVDFNQSYKHWWRRLPAHILTLSGGIYNTQSYDDAVDRRTEFLSNLKTLDDLAAVDEQLGARSAEFVISKISHGDCVFEDIFRVFPQTMLDMDGDGAAELLILTDRFDRSTTPGCYVGSGYYMGARNFYILKNTAEGFEILNGG